MSDDITTTLVVMAAGMGSRYGGLKQMDPVGPNGESLLEYSIYDAIQAGFNKAVFIIRKDFENEFKHQIGQRFDTHIDVQYAYQSLHDLPAGFDVPGGRTKPWGTAQAVLAARSCVSGPFAVQNADDFYGRDAYCAMFDALRDLKPQESAMVGYLLKNTLSPNGSVSRGICESIGGYLSQIIERTHIEKNSSGTIQYTENGKTADMTGEEICSMNLWGFDSSFFKVLEEKFISFLKDHGKELKSEWFIPSVVDEMIQKDETRVKVLCCNSPWFGVTYVEDKAFVMDKLQAMHDSGEYPSTLW